jgi:hypothetical protein
MFIGCTPAALSVRLRARNCSQVLGTSAIPTLAKTFRL